MHKKTPLNASSNIYISFWYKYNRKFHSSGIVWKGKKPARVINESSVTGGDAKMKSVGAEGKHSAVTIRTDVFGSGAADRSVAAAYFPRLSQSFIASVRL